MKAPSYLGIVRNHSDLWSLFGQFCRKLDLESVRDGVVVQEMVRALSVFYPLAGFAVSSARYSNSTSGK
jgi:hypothetical protein